MSNGGSSPDSSPAKVNDQQLYRLLDQAAIPYEVLEHPAVFTVAESQSIAGLLPEGLSIKNLFLKDRKNHFWLLSVAEDRKVNLKALGRVLGAKGGLSFAHADYLSAYLGVRPGSVSPYAILNSAPQDSNAGTKVSLYFDETLYQSTTFHAHPLRNDRSVTAPTKAVIKWLEKLGYPIGRLDFSTEEPQIIVSKKDS